jgi:hypothetical protein
VTTTNTSKPTERETLSTAKGRAIIISLHSTYLTMRLKGRKSSAPRIMTYAEIWTVADDRMMGQVSAARARWAKAKGETK